MSAEVPETVVIYVVQSRVDVPEEDGVVWRDFATVKVPPRTKRKTVIELALQQVKSRSTQEQPDSPWRLRVLPPEAAQVLAVGEKPREPELTIEVVA